MTNSNIKYHSQFIKKVYRVWGHHLAQLLKGTSITANQVTLSRIFLIGAASLCILSGSYPLKIVAAVLIILFSMFDALDGSLAAAKDQRSVLGAWLDPQVDRLGFLLLFLTIAYYLADIDQNYVYLVFYTLTMFYFRGLVGLDVRLKEKFSLLRENTQIESADLKDKNTLKSTESGLVRLLKRIHLEASPHTHNLGLYVAIGLVIDRLDLVMIFVSCYITIWYIWENYKVLRKAKSLQKHSA